MNGEQRRGLDYVYSWTEHGTDGAGNPVSVTVGVTVHDQIAIQANSATPAIMDPALGARVAWHVRESVRNAAKRQFPPPGWQS